MIKKIIYNFILLIFFLLIIFTTILSTTGFETNKFNKLITKKVAKTKNINLNLEKVNFKLDPKRLSLFIETNRPKINYYNILIPTKDIKVYIDFLPLLKTELKIKKININLEELNISQIKELSSLIKPSNFKSFLNQKIKKVKLISEIEIFFNEKGVFNNYIAKGRVRNLEAELLKGLEIKNINLSFFADNDDILIQKIFGNFEEIKISDGDVKLNLENGLIINSSFDSKLKINKEFFKKYEKYIRKNNLIEGVELIEGNFKNSFFINFDETYKVTNYKYSTSGKIDKGKFKLKKSFKNKFIKEEVKEVYFSDLIVDTLFSPKNIKFNGKGNYSFNNLNFFKINIDNSLVDDLLNLNLNFDYGNSFELEVINYKKKNSATANILLNLEKNKTITTIKEFNWVEGSNLIRLKDLKFKKDNFLSFKEIEVSTPNNEFLIKNYKKISIKGSKIDATNLIKLFSKKNSQNNLEKISGDIEIDFKTIKVPLSEQLQNFKLIGKIKNGKFLKISSKGDFGGNNFLDVSMKKHKDSNKKYLEIYSDLTRPLLTEYSFFKGLSGGKLLFTSLIDDTSSYSKLKIENFKVINAPGVIKLLSLADLGGLEDLAKGDGLSFDVLEIDMEKDKNFLKINEIIALGPSMSVLMEGFQDENGITSLRGTLVPAKTLNKLIAKIPVIGTIVIPKEIGEGFFGISFKMKGRKNNIKTTINPIRTLTPRFIQKILDRNKEIK